MFNATKMKKVCRPIRIVLGTALIAVGYFTGNHWFYLGGLPLVAGLFDFCPACYFGTCDIPQKKQYKVRNIF